MEIKNVFQLIERNGCWNKPVWCTSTFDFSRGETFWDRLSLRRIALEDRDFPIGAEIYSMVICLSCIPPLTAITIKDESIEIGTFVLQVGNNVTSNKPLSKYKRYSLLYGIEKFIQIFDLCV